MCMFSNNFIFQFWGIHCCWFQSLYNLFFWLFRYFVFFNKFYYLLITVSTVSYNKKNILNLAQELCSRNRKKPYKKYYQDIKSSALKLWITETNKSHRRKISKTKFKQNDKHPRKFPSTPTDVRSRKLCTVFTTHTSHTTKFAHIERK